MLMRNLAAITVVLLVLTAGAAAQAEGVNNLAAGVNGLVTFPADPGAFATQPPEAFEGMWGEPVTSTILGFFTGVVMMPYRLTMGVLDIALFPFWVFPTLSPEPRFDLFANSEFEVEYD